jgi:heme exporter protein A
LNDETFAGREELRAVHLECIRGERLLFSGLDLRLQSGEILLIEGANGAGKTSLLRILAGLSPPSDGEVLWCGHGIRHRRAEYHADLIYLGHAAGLKAELSPLENLRLWLTLAGLPGDVAVIRAALADVGLAGYEETPTRALSAGQRQRTSLARLLLSPARLWILDEPFNALDVAGIDRIRGLLEKHGARGGMAALTSHQPVALSGAMRTLVLN